MLAATAIRQLARDDTRSKRLSASIRHDIEVLRYEALQKGTQFTVISLERRAADRIGEREIVEFLESLEPRHDARFGLIDHHRIGIVLYDCSASEARKIVRDSMATWQASSHEVQAYATDVPRGLRRRLQPVGKLYVLPTPFWKRAIDVAGAIVGLVVATPVFVAAAIAIKLTSRGPIIFSQERVGLGGEAFQIYKLRTMRSDADEEKHLLHYKNEQDGLGFKIADDPRVTVIGRLLRKSSLDEIPQFINVLQGHMSFVGPRPLPTSDWHPDESWYCQRHDVCPGLTCTWQVSGRSEIGFDEWMQMDIDYVRSRSLGVDMKLLFQTIPAVLSQKGAT